jgi:hypothetical protein
MADPKNPDTTRPFPRDAKETTRPIPSVSDKTAPIAPGGSEITRPTLSITKPTVVFPREATRPIPPVRSATGTRTPAVKSGTGIPTVNRPSGTRTPAVRSSSTRTPAVRSSSTRTPAVRRTGTTPRVSQTNPAIRPDLMTEGMKAHRREVERKKRRAALERMRMEAELSEGWRRIFKTTGVLILVLALVYGYWRVQQAYGNRWPLMAVWLMMAFFILSGFAWILWYMNKSDI